MTRRNKKYWNMTTEELAAATRESDGQGVAETFRPMTPAEQAAWQSAVSERGTGREPERGRGWSLRKPR